MSIRLISGRVKTVPPLSVNGDRYDFIALNQAEPNLGVPYIPSQEINYGWVLTTNLTGGRNWYNAIKWDNTYVSVNTLSSGWESTYETVSELSAYWLIVPQADALYYKLSGGVIDGNVTLNNLTVLGSITVVGGVSSVVTRFNINSSVSAINYAYGPAIYAYQKAFDPNETILLAMSEDYTPVIYASQKNVGFFTQDNSIGDYGVTVGGNLSAKGLFIAKDIIADTLLINGFSAQDVAIVFTKAISALDGIVAKGHTQLESAEITQQLYVSGATSLGNNTIIGGTLDVSGIITGYSGATINGATNIIGNFDVVDGTYLSGGASLESLFANNDDVRKGLNAYANLSANSGYWDSTYLTVCAFSGNWSAAFSTIEGYSARWDSTYTSLNGNSGRYDSVYTTTRLNSADWGGITSTIPYLSTNNILLSSASVLNILSARNAFISNILPVTASNVLLPQYGSEILFNGNYLYTIGNTNINIVDVTDSLSAKLISNISVGTGNCVGSIQGQNIFAASNDGNLYVIDIANPTTPQTVSQTLLLSSTPVKAYAQGRYLYVAEAGTSINGPGIIEIFDISNSLNVIRVASIEGIERIKDFVVQGNFIFTVGFGDILGSNANVTSYVFDGTSISQLGNYSYNPAINTVNASIEIQGRYLFVLLGAAFTFCLAAIDVADPQNLKLEKLNSLSSLYYSKPGSSIKGKYIGKYLYITADDSLLVLNISNLSNVYTERELPLYNLPTAFNIQDRSIYVIDNNSVLTIYDVGGSYIQQLEAGFVGTSELSVKQNATIVNDIKVGGAASFVKGFISTGNSSISGSLAITGDINAKNISATSLLSTFNGTSDNWNSVYTSVAQNSGRYDSVYTTTNTLSDLWGTVYTSFNDVSSRYESVYLTVSALSAYWNDVYNTVSVNSAYWSDAYLVFSANSARYDSVYTSVLGSSAGWNAVYIPLNSLSAGWQSTYATMTALSAGWLTIVDAANTYVPLQGSPNPALPTQLTGNYFINGTLVATNYISAGTTFLSNVTAYNNLMVTGWLSGNNNPWVHFNRASAGNPTQLFGGWNFAVNAGQSWRSPVYGFAAGDTTSATNSGAFATGQFTIAGGEYSITTGTNSYAAASASSTFGSYTSAKGIASQATGFRTLANGDFSIADGDRSVSWGTASHAEGFSTAAVGINSHTEGMQTWAFGNASHAEGQRSIARGAASHAQGLSSVAVGIASISLGQGASAVGDFSIAGNSFSVAAANNTVAFGVSTFAAGDGATTLGYATSALGTASLATGYRTWARAPYGSTFGIQTSALGIGSHAEGFFSIASGDYSHAEGLFTVASGFATHTEGILTTAWGQAAHAEGYFTIAFSPFSHAEGLITSAMGIASHAEGTGSIARDNTSHAEGFFTSAYGDYAHAENIRTRAAGIGSHAEGWNSFALGVASHAEGYFSVASGAFSHAEGFFTVASGYSTHAEGLLTTAWGPGSHAQNNLTVAYGNNSNAEGDRTFAFGETTHAEGLSTFAFGRFSHAEGLGSTTRGGASHAEGLNTLAMGEMSHAEGEKTFAFGFASHTEGRSTSATGTGSHAEGEQSLARGDFSHAQNRGFAFGGYSTAQGLETSALGIAAHSEGWKTFATNNFTHAEGLFTTAWGIGTHAEGSNTQAWGDFSHTQNFATSAFGFASHAEGGNNIVRYPYSHVEGLNSEVTFVSAYNVGTTFIGGSGDDRLLFGASSWRTFANTGGTVTITNNGRNLAKSGGTNSVWDTISFIPTPLLGSWFIKYRRTAGTQTMVGVTRTPLLNPGVGYINLEAASYPVNSTTYQIYDQGNLAYSASRSYTSNWVFMITYDGVNFRHWYNTGADNVWNLEHTIYKPLSGQNIAPWYPAISWWSNSVGSNNPAIADFIFGQLPVGAHAEGYANRALGAGSHAQGMFTVAAGEASNSTGIATSALGIASFAGGLRSVARGTGSFAYGYAASATGDYSYAFGTSGTAYAAHDNSFIVVADNQLGGITTTTRSNQIMLSAAGGVYIPGKLGIGVDPFTQDTIFSIAGGISAQSLQIVRLSAAFIDVDPIGAQAFGSAGFTTFTGRISAKDSASFNQGVATGVNSFAEGRNSFATGDNSHAEGLNTTAAGQASHAEGQNTVVTTGAQAAHAEGQDTLASGPFSHAEGSGTLAAGNASHVEGQNTVALGQGAHAEGRRSVAVGQFSHAAGSYARAHHAQTFVYATGDATSTAYVSSTNAYQFVVSAVDGVFFPGFVGIGINPLSAGDNWSGGTPSERYGGGRLTTTGMISTNALIRTRDAAITRTLTATNIQAAPRYNDIHIEYGPTNRPFTTVVATPITILGSISGFGYTTSFNHGSAGVTTLYSFAANGGRALNDYTFATGLEAQARGIGALAGGLRTIAQGNYSVTQGQLVSAFGVESFAAGRTSMAFGDQSFALGRNNRTVGEQALATGRDTLAFRDHSFTQGNLTSAFGIGAAAFGFGSFASGDYSTAKGFGVSATNLAAHAEGYQSRAMGLYSHAEGFYTSAVGIGAHTEGAFTSAWGYAAHAEGYLSLAYGLYSHAEGHGTRAMQQWSHTEGYLTSATLVNAEDGINTVGGHAEGVSTIAAANWAHAEGNSTIAAGRRAHAEGYLTYAKGYDSHTEGQSTSALGLGAHAEGYFGLAQNDYSHAEGWAGLARGDAAHTEGWGSSALGLFSHSEGYFTTASAQGAHAEGYQTVVGPLSTVRIGGTGFVGNEVFPYNTLNYWLTAGPTTTSMQFVDRNRGITTTGSPGAGLWDHIAWLPIPFYRSGYISFNIGALGAGVNGNYYMVGFTDDPRPTQAPPMWTSQFYSFYVNTGTNNTASLNIAEGGTSNVVVVGTINDTSRLAIVWDLSNIYYLLNGVVQRTVSRPWQTNGPLFVRIAFYGDNTYRNNSIRNLSIGTLPVYTGHAEGIWTRALADAAHAEGIQTVAQGDFSHTEGFLTSAFGFGGHAEGIRTITVREAAHAEGFNTIAYGQYSHAQNLSSVAAGDWSHAEGWATQAEGIGSHAEGRKTIVTPFATFGHAEGAFTTVSGVAAHAEGWAVSAVGLASHAQGLSSYSFGIAANAQNYATSAYGNYSVALGHGTQTRGVGSLAGGISANALHDYSYIWVGDVNVRNAPSTTRSEQFVVSARQGVFIPGYVGIGVDPFNTSTTPAPFTGAFPVLTVRGLLSSTDTIVSQITASDLTIINRISASRLAKYEGDGSLLHSVTATDNSVSFPKLRYDAIDGAPLIFNINNNDEVLINQASSSLTSPRKTRVQHLTGGMVRSPLAAKAFVYFTLVGTTPVIQYSYNVESITYVSTGRYYVRFTNPGYINFQSVVMANAMYNITLSYFTNTGVTVNGYMDQANSTPFQATVTVKTPDNTDVEAAAVYVAIY